MKSPKFKLAGKIWVLKMKHVMKLPNNNFNRLKNISIKYKSIKNKYFVNLWY